MHGWDLSTVDLTPGVFGCFFCGEAPTITTLAFLSWTDTPKRDVLSFYLKNISLVLSALGGMWGKGLGDFSIHSVKVSLDSLFLHIALL